MSPAAQERGWSDRKINGTAANAAEKELAAKLVGDINGVSNVVNNMTIEPMSK
ncbi:MAG: BON domain-containing protein [Kiritimatiellia bacterium]